MSGRGRPGGEATGGAGGEGDGPDLPELARTLDEAARHLRRHARAMRTYPARTMPDPAPPVSRVAEGGGAQGSAAEESGAGAPTALQVRAIAAVRRLRTAWLPDLSGDHAFSMLLELYAAHLEGRRIAQTRLGGVAGVPHTTAIRIAQALQAEGLVTAAADPADKRLTLLGLTDEAARRMEAYLGAALAAGAPLV